MSRYPRLFAALAALCILLPSPASAVLGFDMLNQVSVLEPGSFVPAGVLGSSLTPRRQALVRTAKRGFWGAERRDENVWVFGRRMWTSGTRVGKYPGYNSCARVVSAILIEAGILGKKQMSSKVRTVERWLRGKGWKEIPPGQETPGDVVLWTKPNGSQNHIGIFIGRHALAAGRKATVDNLSLTGAPAIRPMYRNYRPGPWKIRTVLRMP